jgi:hypothetical protein
MAGPGFPQDKLLPSILETEAVVALFKVTYFLNLAKNGWTESYLNNAGSLDSARINAVNHLPALMAMRSVECYCDGGRVQTVPAIRTAGVHLNLFLAGSRPAESTTPAGSAEPTQVAALVQLYGSPATIRASRLIRGIADQDVFRAPGTSQDFPSSELLTAIRAWGNDLSFRSFALGGQNYTADPYRKVSTIAADAMNPGETTITTSDPWIAGAYAVGNQVRFKGIPRKQLPQFKGLFIVTRANSLTNQFNVNLNYAMFGTAALNLTMTYVQRVNTTSQAIRSADFGAWRERKTGRPTSLTRGRSSGLKLRR